MSTTAAHYETHYETLLAPVYAWMAGGAEAAFALGQADLAAHVEPRGLAVDLGAGFGMHSVPLGRVGWRVRAVDSSAPLLGELATAAAGLAVTTHQADLLAFAEHLARDERPNLVLCMGDTLTHLGDEAEVVTLAGAVAAALAPGGRFLATFRDHTRLPQGDARFIPVRADEQRILTCFLEAQGDRVRVHDLLHERTGAGWSTSVSSYLKLRLAPEAVRATFEAAGLRARLEPGVRGMVRLLAEA